MIDKHKKSPKNKLLCHPRAKIRRIGQLIKLDDKNRVVVADIENAKGITDSQVVKYARKRYVAVQIW